MARVFDIPIYKDQAATRVNYYISMYSAVRDEESDFKEVEIRHPFKDYKDWLEQKDIAAQGCADTYNSYLLGEASGTKCSKSERIAREVAQIG